MERQKTERRQKAGRERRMSRRREFDRVLEKGRRFHSPRMTLIAGPGKEGGSRLGVIAPARSGKACDRNRFKRLVREYYRQHPQNFATGTDFVVIAKRAYRHQLAADVWGDLGNLTGRAKAPRSRS